MGYRIIVIDDEQDFLDSVRRGLFTTGYRNVRLVNDSAKAAAMFAQGELFDIALVDITMPGLDGLELLQTIKNCSPGTECIMISAVNEAKIAVEAIRKGAYDYLVKPVSREDLVLKIGHAIERKRLLGVLEVKEKDSPPELAHPEAFREIGTASPRMLRILKEAELHAMSEVPVLITGESGTGKELLARAIHAASPRASFPFTPVNMASLSANFFDADFFGHTKGAFTGAERNRVGYLEATHGGTLFLDEIGVLPLELQGKLLRVIQEGEFAKVGATRTQRVDIRYVAATNEDLEKMVARGTFRKDLYYRLKGGWLHLPPLRERQEDVSLLIARFLKELRNGHARAGIDEKALEILTAYDYPGNIRELKSILSAAANLAQQGPITERSLPDALKHRRAAAKPRSVPSAVQPPLTLADVERSHILNTYYQAGRNKAEASKILGIGLNTLRRKLDAYGEK